MFLQMYFLWKNSYESFVKQYPPPYVKFLLLLHDVARNTISNVLHSQEPV